MKIITLILLFTSLFLNAQEITISQLYSNNKDIQEGKKYLKQNNLNLAIAAFERVLMYDPQNDNAKFYLGQIYAQKNDIQLSKKYFSSIFHPTPKMKEYISKFLQKYPDKHLKFDIYLKIGAFIDNNINNDTSNKEWQIIENDSTKTIYNNNDKKFGIGVYGLLSFSPIYTLKESEIINTFTIYDKHILDNSEKHIAMFSYMPSFTNKLNDVLFQHSINYDYVRYANESYLNRFELNEKIYFNFLKDHTNITNFSIYLNKYIQLHNDNYYGFSFNSKVIKHLFENLDISLEAGIETTIKEKKTANNLEFIKYNTALNTDFYIFSKKINLSANYYIKKYNDENLYFQKKQIDKNIDYKLSINSNHFFTYQTEIEYINNISNLAPYSYNKLIVRFNIIKTFKGL